MTALVSELLDEGRLASNGLSLNVVVFDLVAAVAESVAVHDYALPSRISFVRPTRSVLVHADPIRIAQILDNLIGNALKYSAPDSPVVVSVTTSEAEVQVRVIDRGVGVPDGERGLLFTPFFRTTITRRIAGTGLGLHISRQLAERHRGRVWLEESSNAGSTFTLGLPPLARPLLAPPTTLP
jgi:signal transduction histidine kinase